MGSTRLLRSPRGVKGFGPSDIALLVHSLFGLAKEGTNLSKEKENNGDLISS